MIEGIISYIPTRRRTSNELVENEVNYLIMTSNLPNWNSHSSIFRDQKHGIVDYKGIIKKDNIYGRNLEKKLLNSIATIIEQPTIDNASDSTQFIVSVAMLDDYINGFDINSINTRKGANRITTKVLSKRLNIPIEMAKRTLKATTQLCIRTSDEPTLTKKYKTNDRMLRYGRLTCDLFMDTFFASKGATSQSNFKSCEVFATEFGHIFPIPIEDKSGKNIALSIKRYFKEIGVPLHLICDQAREQVRGDSRI